MMILGLHQLICQFNIAKSQIAQAGIAQGTFTDIGMVYAIAVELVGVVNHQQLIGQLFRQRTGQRFAHRRDGNRIDDGEQFGDFVGRRQR